MRWVDHERRRRRIAEVAIDVIASDGLSAATVRRIAINAGFSTTAITHYFADKQELLGWTFQQLADLGIDRFAEVVARDPADIVGSLMTMTASDAGTIRRWRAYIAYWDQAARDPVIAAHLQASSDAGLQSIASVVRARLGESVDLLKISRLLSAVVQGISLQVLVHQEEWSEDKVRGLLTEQVETVLRGPRL
jgi:TetR/AcrR family transcriptional regulator, transcriptional repressor of bet genes